MYTKVLCQLLTDKSCRMIVATIKVAQFSTLNYLESLSTTSNNNKKKIRYRVAMSCLNLYLVRY